MWFKGIQGFPEALLLLNVGGGVTVRGGDKYIQRQRASEAETVLQPHRERHDETQRESEHYSAERGRETWKCLPTTHLPLFFLVSFLLQVLFFFSPSVLECCWCFLFFCATQQHLLLPLWWDLIGAPTPWKLQHSHSEVALFSPILRLHFFVIAGPVFPFHRAIHYMTVFVFLKKTKREEIYDTN